MRTKRFLVLSLLGAAILSLAFVFRDSETTSQEAQSLTIDQSTKTITNSFDLKAKDTEEYSQVPSTDEGNQVETPSALLEPFVLYEQYLSAAEKGDAPSQYVVAKVLDSCVGTISSEEQLEEVKRNYDLSPDVISRLESNFLRCRRLRSEVGDLRSVKDTWMESAASKGLEIAILHQHVYQSREPLGKEAFQELLIPALQNAADEPYLLEDALYFINVFFSQHAEWRYTERSAWNIVYCQAAPRCDNSELVSEQLTLIHKSAEMEQMQLLAAAYSKAIIEQRWADLDLTHP